MAGDRINQYEIIRELGRGGMGAVYLARDTVLARQVAIKFLLSDNPGVTRRFVVEARATARCIHENIVVIHEVNERDGDPFMVLEYLKGHTLRDRIRGRVLPAHCAVELIVPVVRALVCAHEHDIVHRDLKPENVFVTEAGTVKVLDFGVAKLAQQTFAAPGQETSQGALAPADPFNATNTGALIGTLPYMSPEQLQGERVDHRTDVWAVGIMLCEMVTGRHPLAPALTPQLMEIAELDTPMPRMSQLAPDLGALGSIIDRCLIKPLSDRTAMACDLLAELEPLLPGSRGQPLDDDRNPFTGLAAFQESDADRFFGRDRDIASVVERLRYQPLMTIAGPSGVGKSSLVRAGVIPALKRSGEGWDSFVVRPGRRPMAALASLLARLSPRWTTAHTRRDRTPESVDSEAVARRLRDEPGWLGAELRAWTTGKLRRIVLFVDQFEELYTLDADSREHAAFVACLDGAADDASSPVRVILSMRSDFLDRVAEHRAFMSAVTAGLVLLAPIGRDGLRDALTRPVRAANHDYESPELVDVMLDALEATPGALPLLQFTASKLWDARDRERRVLTRASYEAFGGVAGTLASHADAVLVGMSATQLALARTIFERLVTPERTRTVVSVRELCELPGDGDATIQMIRDLASARLLAMETDDDGDAAVELIHESLIDRWPTLGRWLDANQEHTAMLARVRTAAREWERSGRPDGLLWRNEPAREARWWDQRYTGVLPETDRRYLDAVFALSSRSRRNRRRLVIGTIAVLAGLVIVGTVGLIKLSGQNHIIRAQLVEIRQTERQRQAALNKEREARAKAEHLERTAKAAQRQAEAALDAVMREKRLTEQARDQAQRSEAAARAQKAVADKAARDARSARDQAQKAKAAAEIKAEEAAAAADRERRERRAKEALIDRAAGPVNTTVR